MLGDSIVKQRGVLPVLPVVSYIAYLASIANYTSHAVAETPMDSAEGCKQLLISILGGVHSVCVYNKQPSLYVLGRFVTFDL